MYSKKTPMYIVFLASLAMIGTIIIGGQCGLTNGYPASIDSLTQFNKLGGKHDHGNDQMAERDFRNFIHSKDSSDSTVIGEIKPNASDLEMMVLRSKIASAILNMQESETNKPTGSVQQQTSDQPSECFIEVTKVERVPGKCHRVNNGLPICQSENYMAVNRDCS